MFRPGLKEGGFRKPPSWHADRPWVPRHFLHGKPRSGLAGNFCPKSGPGDTEKPAGCCPHSFAGSAFGPRGVTAWKEGVLRGLAWGRQTCRDVATGRPA